jgi:hypothetical protein
MTPNQRNHGKIQFLDHKGFVGKAMLSLGSEYEEKEEGVLK